MLVQVLPAAMLFSALWTLLGLNRRSELVAFQCGGMAPIWLFSPFFLFAALWVAVLAYDLSGPAAKAEVTRERLLLQVKGQSAKRNVFTNLPYVDLVNHRVWILSKFGYRSGHGARMWTILQRDAEGHDMIEYGASEGHWTGAFWRLSNVKKMVYRARIRNAEPGNL